MELVDHRRGRAVELSGVAPYRCSLGNRQALPCGTLSVGVLTDYATRYHTDGAVLPLAVMPLTAVCSTTVRLQAVSPDPQLSLRLQTLHQLKRPTPAQEV